MEKMTTSISPQSQSLFITRLPREIRDMIYLAIWQSPDHGGLRQHIIFHRENNRKDKDKDKDKTGWHFCRWPCSLEKFNVQDPLQSEIEQERIRVGVELGRTMHHIAYARRLNSPWFDHWACGEEAERSHGIKAIQWHSTSVTACWRAPRPVKDLGLEVDDLGSVLSAEERGMKIEGERERERIRAATRTSWLPMLLVCKVISAEVLKSIYESTTFILTDVWTLQHFLGFCQMPPSLIQANQSKPKQVGIPPPGLFRYATSLEISLSAGFSYELHCSDRSDFEELEEYRKSKTATDADPRTLTDTDNNSASATTAEPLHDAYDFHWLRLDQFENLRSVKIWVAARGQFIPDECQLVATPDLSADKVKNMLDCLGKSKVSSIMLSMPLAEDIGPPEDGYVEGMSPRADVRLWKRGTGDRFQPSLAPIFDHYTPSRGLIFARPRREVHVSRRDIDTNVISPWGGWD